MERAAPVKHPVSPKRPEADTCSRTGQPEVLFWQDSGGKSPLLKPGACVPGFNRKERPRLGTLPSMPPARTRRMTGRCLKFTGTKTTMFCEAKLAAWISEAYLPVRRCLEHRSKLVRGNRRFPTDSGRFIYRYQGSPCRHRWCWKNRPSCPQSRSSRPALHQR